MTSLRPPGPTAERIWRAVPFLEQVSAEDYGRPEFEAIRRRVAEGHPCVLCGGRALGAVIARPRQGEFLAAVWADLCGECFSRLKAEEGGGIAPEGR